MKCAKVLKKKAEKVKQLLIESKALSRDYRTVVEKEYIYFPLEKVVQGLEVVDKDCQKIIKEDIDLSSFDQVGDIIIVGEDTDLETAKQFLKRKNIKVVLRKVGIHHGEFRTQDMEWVAGEKRKETVYKENGVQMRLDVEQCYFSPRLSTERRRVADLVQDDERVLVLFSGIAPYPLVIAKHANPKVIVGVEKNPVAHKYAVENCKKYSNIQLFNLDANDFISEEKFDRIIMPLPKSAEDFLDTAVKLAGKGATIHLYDFVLEKDIPDVSIAKIKKHIVNFEVLEVTRCGQYAPGKYRVCIDFRV